MNQIKQINIKKLLNSDNKTMLIGLLSILVVIWLIIYVIPDFFGLLFNTFLGNLILILIVVLTIARDIKYGIGLGIIFIILYRFSHLLQSKEKTIVVKEGFTWKQDSIDEFLRIQSTLNPNIVFDPVEMQKQASQQELDYYLQNGMWPWTKEAEELYKNAQGDNPYIRSLPEDSVKQTRRIYNQSSMLQAISLNTKEGNFLTSGIQIHDANANTPPMVSAGSGTYGFNSGLVRNLRNPTIKCGTNKEGKSVLQKIEYQGDGGILGEHDFTKTDLDPSSLEGIIPGFSFANGACNPCEALDDPPSYNCAFNLKLKDKNNNETEDTEANSIWTYLWSKPTLCF